MGRIILSERKTPGKAGAAGKGFKNLVTRLALLLLVFAAVFGLILSCENSFLFEDGLKTFIGDKVSYETAPVRSLTINTDGFGITSPLGTVTLKDNFAINVSAGAYPGYYFKTWEQVSGAGVVTFTDATASETQVKISSGDAVIMATFSERPKILALNPSGSNVFTSSLIKITFNNELDAATITSGTVAVKESYTTPVDGTLSYSNKMITFTPGAAFKKNTAYTCLVTTGVLDADGRGMYQNFEWTFSTGNDSDTWAPTVKYFRINEAPPDTDNPGTAPDFIYTNSRSVTLYIRAADDAGTFNGSVESIYIKNYGESETPEPLNDDTETAINWTLLDLDGTTNNSIIIRVADNSGNTSNPLATGATSPIVVSTIFLDRGLPVSGSVDINSGAVYTGNTTVTLTIIAADNASGSGIEKLWISNTADFSTGDWEDFIDVNTDGTYDGGKSWSLVAGDGQKTVYLRFKDKAGNISVFDCSDSIVLDQSVPQTGFTINNGAIATALTAISLAISSTDAEGSGVAEMSISGQISAATGWIPFAATWNGNLTAGDAEKTVNVQVRDTLGNTTALIPDTIILDTVNPTAGSISINAGATGTSSTLVELTLSASDNGGGSGIAGMMLSNYSNFAGGAWGPYTTTINWNLLDGDGIKTVYVKFRDHAVNEGGSYNDSITLDTQPPSGGFLINSGASYTNSMSVTLNNNVSGVTQMRFSNDNSTWSTWETYATTKSWTITSGDGNKTVYGEYRDAILNTTSASDTIILDTVAPAISSAQILGTSLDQAYTNSTTVSISSTLTGSPAEMRFMNSGGSWSAWEPYSTQKTGWTLASPTTEGTKTVYYQFRDAAGNTTSASLYDTIILDTIAPVISSCTINNNAVYTTGSTVSIYSTVTGTPFNMRFMNSGGSWSAWENYATSKNGWTVATPTTDGTKTVYHQFRDAAGNTTSASLSDSIILDTTPPTVISFTINNGAATTPSLSSTLYFNVTDTNGVTEVRHFYNSLYGEWHAYTATQTADFAFTATAGSKTYYAAFKDTAGNTTSWISDAIILEVPEPTYADKGYYNSGSCRVYFNDVTQPAGTNYYYFYSTTNAQANPNNGDPVDYEGNLVHGGGTYKTTSLPQGEIRYFFIRAYNTTTGGYGPYSTASVFGFSSHMTIIYDNQDATDIALAGELRDLITNQIDITGYTGVTGTMPAWTVTLLPENMVSTSYSAANVIYGDPVLITSSSTIYSSTTKTRNVVDHGRGVVAIGYGGTRLLDTCETNWSAWGYSDQAPNQIGYGESSLSAATKFVYTWTSGNSTWTSPLTSTSIPGTDNTSTQASYADINAYSAFLFGGINPTGGAIYARDYFSVNNFPIVRQGRFLQYGFAGLLNRVYTGKVHFVNLLAVMDNY